MFDWETLLPLAERLAVMIDDEAAQRTAINRAYYAAYHAASSFVAAVGLFQGRRTHAKVWDTLANSSEPERAEVGRRGDRLRQTRIDADYRNPFPGDINERTVESIAMAREVIEALRHLG